MYSTAFLILTFIKYNYTLINFLTKKLHPNPNTFTFGPS